MNKARLIELQSIIARTQSDNAQRALAESPEFVAAGGEKTVGNAEPWMPTGDDGMGVSGFGGLLVFLGFDVGTACDFAPFGEGWEKQEHEWPATVRAVYRMRELADPRAMCSALSDMIEEA